MCMTKVIEYIHAHMQVMSEGVGEVLEFSETQGMIGGFLELHAGGRVVEATSRAQDDEHQR